jgi:hypothetical protein
LHLDYPFAGSRMPHDLLRGEGIAIGRDRVTTMMRRMGIEAIYCCRVAENYRKSARSRCRCHLSSEFPRARFRTLRQYRESTDLDRGSSTASENARVSTQFRRFARCGGAAALISLPTQ